MELIKKRDFLKYLGVFPLVISKAYSQVLKPRTTKKEAESIEFRLCFGSCNRQNHSQEYWPTIQSLKPDSWFWLGDNIYGDTRELATLKKKYNKQFNDHFYKNFRKNVSIDGIWDDHDYGENNADKTYPLKEDSQQLFLNFMEVDKNSPRRQLKGIYYSKEFSLGKGKVMKAYFLDCRYFRNPRAGRGETLIGEDQWQWLEQEMASSNADVNVIVSSIGVLLNRLFVTEDWGDYPDDKNRLLDMVREYNLSGVFFLSGDKHFGAMIKRKWNGDDFFEFQSSGLTHQMPAGLRSVAVRMYGPSNVIVDRNFAQIDFSENSSGELFMSWKLNSLENGEKFVKRKFILNQNNRWEVKS